VAVLGLLLGLRILTGDAETATPPPQAGMSTADSEATHDDDEVTPAPLPLTADNVRIVDPPDGSRTELDGVEALVDGDLSTSWRTDRYLNDPRFGLLKPGMGILVD